jgi:hypothetical protein
MRDVTYVNSAVYEPNLPPNVLLYVRKFIKRNEQYNKMFHPTATFSLHEVSTGEVVLSNPFALCSRELFTRKRHDPGGGLREILSMREPLYDEE